MVDRDKKSPQYYADIIAAMAERTIKRLWLVVLVLVILCTILTGLYAKECRRNNAYSAHDNLAADTEITQAAK